MEVFALRIVDENANNTK